MTATTYPGSASQARRDEMHCGALAKREMPIPQLVNLLRAINTMMDVGAGMCCQPTFTDCKNRHTPAGRELDVILDFLCDRYLDVLARLRDARTTDESELEDRRVELLKNDLGCCKDTTDVALAAVVKAMPQKF